ncbi:hypothetical protein HNO52_11970 [Billgrantia diversa]|nr:hypothetical protein HNO52_11970 [Halomonas sp. MCCC 1A13316]
MQEEAQETPVQAETGKTQPTIVGIGASAGGLAALKRFFANVPERTGLSFVVVMHLSPEHESHLADLLQPFCRLPVRQVTETIALEPDTVYVIPPGRNLNTVDTHLRLSQLEERGASARPSITSFVLWQVPTTAIRSA